MTNNYTPKHIVNSRPNEDMVKANEFFACGDSLLNKLRSKIKGFQAQQSNLKQFAYYE